MIRLDRTITRKTTLHADQDAEDAIYWLTKTPTERLAALEYLRAHSIWFYYRHDPSQFPGPGLQRVYRAVKRA
ncbi:hypothetical protein [Hymenobacter fastidiosus]|uniref:hypothetical protein n=1 Tax=Hymenobacter fastidiosus TaxID=486264 RepID=UPI0031ED4773